MATNILILTILTLAALFTVMTRSLLRAAIGLAATSAVLSIIMFRFNAPYAAAFELSVCAGLISALFFSIITLTQPLTPEKVLDQMKLRMTRFWYLPFILVICAGLLVMVRPHIGITLPVPDLAGNVRTLLWNLRQIDLVGQIIILLAGVFGIVILLKEMGKKNG